MRRRRVPALLLIVAVFAPAYASAGSVDASRGAWDVRNAVPALEAYNADHGGYTGVTLAKLRAYDKSVRRIAFRKATKKTYCIESTSKEPAAHKAGPGAQIRTGRCGTRGRVVEWTTPTPQPPPPSSDAALAQQRLRAAIPAIEAYNADNRGYTGMTLEKLQRYDAGVSEMTIAWAQSSGYCIESTAGASTYHYLGPAAGLAAGACPAASAHQWRRG